MGEWNFDETIRGTMKGMKVNLDLAGLEIGDSDEEGEGEWEVGMGGDEDGEEEVPWESVRVRVDGRGEGLGGRGMNVSLPLLRAWPESTADIPVFRDIVTSARAVLLCHSRIERLASDAADRHGHPGRAVLARREIYLERTA